MPTYDYACSDCGERFSRTESITTHGHEEIGCPVCASSNVERVFVPFYAKTVRKS